MISFRLKSYFHLMRLHRPLPILLALFPALWGLWLASEGVPSFKYLAIFLVGTLLMRSAGCVINDLWDKNIDAEVARTKARPLAANMIPIHHALLLALILLLAAASLLLFLNALTFFLALAAFGATLLYPLAKRLIPIPQIVLGIAFNFGLLMAFSAIQNTLPLQAFEWFLLSIIWTLIYDTEYALADYDDDARIGIYSSALLFGRQVRLILILLQSMMTAYFIFLLYPHYPFKIGLVLFTLGMLALFARQQQLLKQQKFLTAFHHNHWVGLLVFLSLILKFQ